MKVNLNELPKFDKSQRSTFKYWWAHYKAFNKVAKNCNAWKFKYLFHDIEKPFLRLLFKYEKVQKWHRYWNRHHIQYHNPYKIDWEGMAIDWECSQYTKKACPRNAYQEYLLQIEKNYSIEREKLLVRNMPNTLKKLGLWKKE